MAGGLKTHEAPPHPVSWRKIRWSGMTAAAVAAAAVRRRRRSRESGWMGVGGVAAGVEKYNFSSSIAVSVITACHALNTRAE